MKTKIKRFDDAVVDYFIGEPAEVPTATRVGFYGAVAFMFAMCCASMSLYLFTL